MRPVHTAPKILWLKRHEPAVFERAHKLLGIHEYLLWLLSGEFATDASIASRSCLMDIASLRWSKELLERMGIPEEKLCELRLPGSICGRVSERAARLCGLPAGLPVCTAGGDQQCAALGMGVAAPGDMLLNVGTGIYALSALERPEHAAQRDGVACVAAARTGGWLLEASCGASARLYQQCRDTYFGGDDSYAGINAAAWKAEAALCAQGPCGWLNEPRAGIAYLTLRHIADEAAACVRRLEKTADAPLPVSGGLTRQPLFLRLLA
ncbi:MAG: FGGY family carbohydrate kinase, partial [Clostridia bacterium]|nr:FGGY family carbohydrate kinase [Clostridia bacterium]